MNIDDTAYAQTLEDDRLYATYLERLETIYADMDEIHDETNFYTKKLLAVRRMKQELMATLPESDDVKDGLLDAHKSVREATIRRIAGQSALAEQDAVTLTTMILECSWKFYEPELIHQEETETE